MNRAALPHSPFGANASFDFGPPGEPAGFFPSSPAAAPQDVFVGCRPSSREPWSLLPFFTAKTNSPQPLPKGRYGRFLAWAGDKWMIGPLVFKLCTPFSPSSPNVEDDAFHHAPVVCGYLEYDNSHSADAAELIFGVGGERVSANDLHGLAGFGFDASYGFATAASTEVELRRDAAVFDAEIGPVAALHFNVPPHAKRIYPLALGFFAPGFYYERHFTDLAAVLAHGLAAHARYLAVADARDAEFMRSPLAFDLKTRAAIDVRRWLAGTQRLADDPEVDVAPLRELCRVVTG
jgi:hypothetical protein